jgi:hypothetical protein
MDQIDNIQDHIYVIRGYRVMLDSDIAGFYGVETKRLNESTRAQLDAISTALAELQAKPSETKPRKPIGFIQTKVEDNKK